MAGRRAGRRKLVLGALAAGGGIACRRLRAAGDESVMLQPELLGQTIEGFGASGCWTFDPVGVAWSAPNLARLADLLFSPADGIGLSLWRFNIGAGHAWAGQLWDPWRGAECFRRTADETPDWSRQAGQQRFLDLAWARGLRQVVGFTNSPPVWLTVNGKATGDQQTGSTNLRPGAAPEFAAFLADVAEHFQRRGTPLTTISPINEPNWEWTGGGQEGCRYNNDDLVTVIRAVHAELTRRRLSPDLETPEAGDLNSLLADDLHQRWSGQGVYRGGNNKLGKGRYGAYCSTLLEPTDLRQILGGAIAAHSYWTDQGERNLVGLRRTLRENLDRLAPGLRYRQTEYCVMEHKRDLGMAMALRVARVIHHDLADAGASVWTWWLALSPGDYKDGLLYTDWKQTGQQNILVSKTLWALGNYSRFLRPGWRRIGCTAPAGLLATAWLSPDSRQQALVVVNSGGERALRLPAGAWTAHVTSAAADLAAQPVGATCNLPAQAVVTLCSPV
ncbi:MAG: hypothetical protein IT204_11500 [Fimbriimonadaceae bacterium]|nr:hypothetical protein [Fimbriimonadaceae bacterium]